MNYLLILAAWLVVSMVFAFVWGALCQFGDAGSARQSKPEAEEKHHSMSA